MALIDGRMQGRAERLCDRMESERYQASRLKRVDARVRRKMYM